MNKRDVNRLKLSGRIPRAVLDELLSDGEDEDIERKLRRKELYFKEDNEDFKKELEQTESIINNEQTKGSLSVWLRQVHVIRYVQHIFRSFIKNYKGNDGSLIYEKAIIDMCSNNRQSLEVTYSHISQFNDSLSKWIIECPQLILEHLNYVAFELTCEIFPHYSNIFQEIFVRNSKFETYPS
jgi:DNA replication licensing factor MCM2